MLRSNKERIVGELTERLQATGSSSSPTTAA